FLAREEALREPGRGPRLTSMGSYLTASMAARTLRTVSSLTTGTEFKTRETVAVETPAYLATCTIDISNCSAQLREPALKGFQDRRCNRFRCKDNIIVT